MSDHLPSILDSELKYKYGFNTNIGLLIFNKKTINISSKKYFEIPWLIWDKLADTKHRKTIDKNKMESLYFSALLETL